MNSTGLRCLGGGSNDGIAVFPEDPQPALDVSGVVFARLGVVFARLGVVFARLGVDLQVGTEERGRKFGDQFFHSVPVAAEAVGSIQPVQLGLMTGPVSQ